MNSQALIYISLGFVAASLLAVLLNRIIFKKAYKKAVNEMRGQIPLNQAEMHAERDRLRAEYAVNLNKLEFKVAAMQQSELGLRIESTKTQEQKTISAKNLDESIKTAVMWEEANHSSKNEISILKNKLKIQDALIDDMNENVAKHQVELKTFEKAKRKYQISDDRLSKLQDEYKEALDLLKDTGNQLDKMTAARDLQNIELEAAHKNNVTFEAKISEISTQMLFLGQELFAKKISIDLSEKAIDKYKNKLLVQKLAMREASLKDKAIYAIKSKLDGSDKLNLADEPVAEATQPSLTSINTSNMPTTSNLGKVAAQGLTKTKPTLVPDVVQNNRKTKLTGLRGRMNSLASGTDD